MPKYPLSSQKLCEKFDIWAIKSRSQNFLFNEAITDQIARLARVQPEQRIFEIGAGPGGLSQSLLQHPIESLTIIEMDARFLPIYELLAEFYSGRLHFIMGDALKIDPPAPHLVANIPYQITTPILLYAIAHRSFLESVTLLVQQEVADRMVAEPSSKQYGRLSVLVQAFFDCSQIYQVPARAFVPAPKVDSALVRMIPRIYCPPLGALERVTQIAFGNRRKMLRNCFSAEYFPWLARVDIGLTQRAENITVAQYCQLAQLVNSQNL